MRVVDQRRDQRGVGEPLGRAAVSGARGEGRQRGGGQADAGREERVPDAGRAVSLIRAYSSAAVSWSPASSAASISAAPAVVATRPSSRQKGRRLRASSTPSVVAARDQDLGPGGRQQRVVDRRDDLLGGVEHRERVVPPPLHPQRHRVASSAPRRRRAPRACPPPWRASSLRMNAASASSNSALSRWWWPSSSSARSSVVAAPASTAPSIAERRASIEGLRRATLLSPCRPAWCGCRWPAGACRAARPGPAR